MQKMDLELAFKGSYSLGHREKSSQAKEKIEVRTERREGAGH